MLADRINVVEGVFSDFARGRVPNLVEEFGIRARLRSDDPAFRRVATTALLGGGLAICAYLLARRRDSLAL